MLLPFSITLRPGRPIHDQIVFAVTKAVVTGQLRIGDRFPSVRTLSQELEINPNTAQRAIASLVERGLLDVQPGVGTVVAGSRPRGTSAMRSLLGDQIDRLIVDARCLGLGVGELVALIRRAWQEIRP